VRKRAKGRDVETSIPQHLRGKRLTIMWRD
jgi:hypothetical protein